MALQNRVTPRSQIVADPARGMFFGNRGCLHDALGNLRRDWVGRDWICCLTEFKGRRRAPMPPGRYTGLFFLDEAVALAAGHRPCAECRRVDYNRFRQAWWAAGLGDLPRAQQMDACLHAGRRVRGGEQLTHLAPFGSLPDGTFVAGPDGQSLLVAGDRLLTYHPGGYGRALPRPGTGEATVLTPAPVVAVIAAGYRPQLHPTAA